MFITAVVRLNGVVAPGSRSLYFMSSHVGVKVAGVNPQEGVLENRTLSVNIYNGFISLPWFTEWSCFT